LETLDLAYPTDVAGLRATGGLASSIITLVGTIIATVVPLIDMSSGTSNDDDDDGR
jgi:hypothetical protein